MLESEESETKQLYRASERFGRFYAITKSLRERIMFDPEYKIKLWFMWKEDDGDQMLQQGVPVGTPADIHTTLKVMSRLTMQAYEYLESHGEKQVALDTIDYLDKQG